MTVGERIRAVRKSAGMTQKQVGEGCGIAESTIRRYEIDDLNPKFDTVIKIAKVLGVSPLYLWGYSESVFDNDIPDPERERFIIRTYEQHHKETLDEFNALIKTVTHLQSFYNKAGFLSLLNDMAVLLDALNTEGCNKAVEMVEELTERTEYQAEEK